MPRVQAGAISVNYDERGAGEPMLLINGFGGSSAGWRPELLADLARYHRVITFDNRGTGLTDKPESPYSLALMADDAANLLDALGVARAHVVGVSMGGMIAQELALRHPEKVNGLVLGCTHCGPPVSVAAGPEIVALLFAPEGMTAREAARHGWAAAFTPEYIAAHEDLLDAKLERILVNPTPAETRQRQFAAVQQWQSHDRLDTLAPPVLIITGDRDVLMPPENSRILHERIAGSQLAVIPGAAHSFHDSHPEEMVRLVREFLSALPVPAAAMPA